VTQRGKGKWLFIFFLHSLLTSSAFA